MWQEMYRLVFSYLHHRGLDRQDAEDLAQEVMVAACIHLDVVEPGKLKPWLYTVARHKYIDWLRCHRRGVVLVSLEAMTELTTREGEPEALVMDREYSDLVRTVMEGLNPAEWELLIFPGILFPSTAIRSTINQATLYCTDKKSPATIS